MHSQKFIAGLWAVFCLVVFAANLASAQEEQQRGPWVRGLQGAALHQFESDLEDGDGDFSVSRFFIQPSLGYAWDRRNTLSLSVGYGESDYDFSSGAEIDGLAPWGTIRDFRISMPIRFSPSERSDVIIIPSVRSFAEKGADLNDGRTEGLIAGASWRFSDRLTIGPGFGWYSELDGGSQAFPILVIDWQITDKLSVTTGRGLAATQGPGLTLGYNLNSKWQLGLTGRYEKVRFAVNESGPAASGIGEERSLPLLLTLNYTPWPMTTISALVGAEFDGRLSLEDASGRELGRSEFDTAPVIGLSFTSRF